LVGAKVTPHQKGAELGKRRRKSGVVVIDKEIIFSKAFLSLSGIAPQVYLIFLSKRKYARVGRKWMQTNNGEIEFPYDEAQDQFGITKPRFTRAIDQLIKHGFLDIAKPGGGICGVKTLYSISERWQKFDTPDFEYRERKKRKGYPGFQKGHLDYRKLNKHGS